MEKLKASLRNFSLIGLRLEIVGQLSCQECGKTAEKFWERIMLIDAPQTAAKSNRPSMKGLKK